MKLYTVPQAAEIRNVTRSCVHRWIAAGLPFRWKEGRRMISAADLKSFRPRHVGPPRKN